MKQVDRSSRDRSPESLLRLLTALSLAAILLVILLTSYGLYRVYSGHVLHNAEEDAVRIGAVALAQEGDVLISGSPPSIAIEASEMEAFDSRLRTFLSPFGIVKIKIFDAGGRIVYSTDLKIIGKVDRDNPRLARALGGQVDSHQETKEEMVDLAEEGRFDVDVVETYVPLRDSEGRVIGSFEFYVDVTGYREEIAHGVGTSVAILALILLAVFFLSFVVLRIGTDELKVAQEKLRRLATTDSLTGVLNRGETIHRAEEALVRISRRRGKAREDSLGVIMIDIDRFKKINDSCGHLVGDEVLRQVARRVRSHMRVYDVFGRYGGEEFLVVAPETGREGVMALAERIHDAIRKEPFVVGGLPLSVTASLGASHTLDPEEAFDSALNRADQALYRAKDSGRDRVLWAAPPSEEDSQAAVPRVA